MRKFSTWLTEIEQSKEGSTKINISIEFEEIFSRNIITISLGEDISDNLIPITIFNDDGTITEKGCSVREALHIVFDQLIKYFP
jgi:hypothetical protein